VAKSSDIGVDVAPFRESWISLIGRQKERERKRERERERESFSFSKSLSILSFFLLSSFKVTTES